MTSKNTVLLTGIPRSGTTLCCHLLNQQDNAVALHEPLPPKIFDSISKTGALKSIRQFAYSARQEVLSGRPLPSKHIDGSVPSNPVESDVSELRAERSVWVD